MLQLYEDGKGGWERPLTTPQGEGIYTTSSGGVIIGNNVYNGYPFHGAIADLRIFNRVLSAEEIAALAER